MSVFSTIFEKLELVKDKDLLREIHGDSFQSATGAQISDWVARARTSLKEAGVSPGTRVGLLSPNSNQWVAADLAIIAQKAVVVPLYARQEPKELAEMLEDCGAELVLCSSQDLEDGLSKAWPKVSDKDAPKTIVFEQLFNSEPSQDKPELPESDDLVTIIYTSGTSGKAKGVMLNRGNIDFMIPQTVKAIGDLYSDTGSDERVFHYLPFCFAGSRTMLWTQLYRGNPLMMSSDLNNLIVEVGTAAPHYFLNVPTLLERIRRGVRDKLKGEGGWKYSLYNMGVNAYMRVRAGEGKVLDSMRVKLSKVVFNGIRKKVASSWDFLICGSAPLSEETQAWFELLEIPVYQVYGLTETTAIVTMDKPNKIEAGKVGYPIEGIEMKVSEEGELLIKGPNIFTGYWELPEKTAEAIVDGWFYTGDLAEIDELGNWKIVGRSKNVLVPESGHNVAPEPIEQMILEACEDLQQAVVIGHGRRYLTCIVTGDAQQAVIQKALDTVNEELPHYRQIRKFHHAEEELTYEKELLTANQKLRRNAIESYFKDQIEGLYGS
jgi:long-chain acyl-CoA synthetase